MNRLPSVSSIKEMGDQMFASQSARVSKATNFKSLQN